MPTLPSTGTELRFRGNLEVLHVSPIQRLTLQHLSPRDVSLHLCDEKPVCPRLLGGVFIVLNGMQSISALRIDVVLDLRKYSNKTRFLDWCEGAVSPAQARRGARSR